MNRAFIFSRTFEEPSRSSWEKSSSDARARRLNTGFTPRGGIKAAPAAASTTTQAAYHDPPSATALPSPPPSDLLFNPPPAIPPPPQPSLPASPQQTSPGTASPPPPDPAAMADKELATLTSQLQSALRSSNPSGAAPLLSRAKLALLNLNALIPSPSTPQKHLLAAREILELGALISIKQQDPDGFTRYFQQLQPFYSLPEHVLPRKGGSRSKITGLFLLLLLSQGDYAGFHTLLESLEVASVTSGGGKGLEDDAFIQYPIRLEQALMEGSYDRVWGETKSERVPSEEFSVFSTVLINTIRSEIASCSEKAYPSIPITDAKSLLFLESEGAVIEFAKQRGWSGKDGRIYFPQQEQENLSAERDVMQMSGQVIQNTLGYARELETIV